MNYEVGFHILLVFILIQAIALYRSQIRFKRLYQEAQRRTDGWNRALDKWAECQARIIELESGQSKK